MKRSHSSFLLIFLAFWITGGQWMLLQSAAWIHMVRDYSQTESLCQAFSKTFDGNHPCPLCRLIEKEKAAQNSQKVAPTIQKYSFLPIPFALLEITLFSKPNLFYNHPPPHKLFSEPLSPPPEAISQA